MTKNTLTKGELDALEAQIGYLAIKETDTDQELAPHLLGALIAAARASLTEDQGDFETAIEAAEARPPTQSLKDLLRDAPASEDVAGMVERLKNLASTSIMEPTIYNDAAALLEKLAGERDTIIKGGVEAHKLLATITAEKDAEIEKLEAESSFWHRAWEDERQTILSQKAALADAKAECERLKIGRDTMGDLWADAKDECERLREALEDAERDMRRYANDPTPERRLVSADAIKLARAATDGGNEQ